MSCFASEHERETGVEEHGGRSGCGEEWQGTGGYGGGEAEAEEPAKILKLWGFAQKIGNLPPNIDRRRGF